MSTRLRALRPRGTSKLLVLVLVALALAAILTRPTESAAWVHSAFTALVTFARHL